MDLQHALQRLSILDVLSPRSRPSSSFLDLAVQQPLDCRAHQFRSCSVGRQFSLLFQGLHLVPKDHNGKDKKAKHHQEDHPMEGDHVVHLHI